MADNTKLLRDRFGQRWHELKTDPDPFSALFLGLKPYELRLNDRDYKPLDYLVLRETLKTGIEMADDMPLVYTGRILTYQVISILYGDQHSSSYGIKAAWALMGLGPIHR